ncbi:cold shock domain-containing protein [Kitasatospora sp. NBC_01266]|uniref:cold shock domain-containing protein n=1 Tax=Kitasatospora sp. NBC_01266 TaxID=2903572 RepID=UPI002E3460FE|nr:cold shock domain-containing protein [Kitasatospora sp. NBC_01266]
MCLGVGVVSGRVVRFDAARGYGFIAPAQGGEDVFLHVNDLQIPEPYIRPGLVVEFEVEDGDRGPKASFVRLPEGAAAPTGSAPAAAAAIGAVRRAPADDSLCDVLSAEEYTQEVTEVLLAAAPTLTGAQILQIRAGLLRFGKDHGWTED